MRILTSLLFTLLLVFSANAQVSPDFVSPSDGDGPFDRLVIRGAIMIEGSGAPPTGPVDIVIENDRIVEFEMSDTQASH